MRKLNIKGIAKPAVGAVAGYAAAEVLVSQVLSKITAIPAEYRPYIPAVIGVGVAAYFKNPIALGVGLGMISNTAAKVLPPLLGKLVPAPAAQAGIYDSYGQAGGFELGMNGTNQAGQYNALDTATQVAAGM
jgi:hypothetical protein